MPNQGYCEYCCTEHGNTGLSLRQWIHFLWLNIQKWDNASHNSSVLNFLRNLHTMIPWEFHRYTSLPTVYKHSFFSSASITFVIFYILVLAIQTGKRWYRLSFWSAFPLIISDAEHLVIYLLIIYMSYLWENVYSLKM